MFEFLKKNVGNHWCCKLFNKKSIAKMLQTLAKMQEVGQIGR